MNLPRQSGILASRWSAGVIVFFALIGPGRVLSLGGSAEPKPKLDFREAISQAVAGEYEAALELFRAELFKAPEDPLANYYVGMTEYKLEKFAASTVYFEKAISNDAPFPQAYFWLAKAYRELGIESKATEATRLGLARFPRNADLVRLAGALGVD